jgi:hypothetical protein
LLLSIAKLFVTVVRLVSWGLTACRRSQ